jgi:hypothetical protein
MTISESAIAIVLIPSAVRAGTSATCASHVAA